MRRLQQLLFKLRVPMLILLPLWVAIGRLMFGAGGWLLLVTIFIVGPLLFVGLLTIFLLAKRRRDIVGGVLPKKDAIYMLIIYVSFFLYGFLIEDGGDTAESEASAATKLFHMSSSDVLNTFGQVCVVVGIASLVGYITYSTAALRRKKH